MDYSRCPACGRQISVTVGGRLRKHNDAPAYGHVCIDSGLLVHPVDPTGSGRPHLRGAADVISAATAQSR